MLTQKQLAIWLPETHCLKITQATITSTLKRKAILVKIPENSILNVKRQRAAKYPMMETALIEWFNGHQARVNLSDNLVRETAERILDCLCPGHDPFNFSNTWLEAFRPWHNIRS